MDVRFWDENGGGVRKEVSEKQTIPSTVEKLVLKLSTQSVGYLPP